MANILTGRVIEVTPTKPIQTKTGTPFVKRELILDCTRYDPYTGQRGFENTPCISFTQNNCSLLDNVAPGSIVAVSIDIVGRKGSDPAKPSQYFNDIRGYKVEVVRQPDGQQPQPYPQPQQAMPQAMPQQPVAQPQPMPQNPQYPQQPPYGNYAPGPQYPPQGESNGLPF